MKKILFLGRFPPPVHGAALMNESYFNALKQEKDFEVNKIKINYSDSLDQIGKINFKKFFGFFIVFFKLLSALIFSKPKIIYFELAPRGFAFYRDSIYVLVCKIFHKKIIFHFQAKGVNSLGRNILSKYYLLLLFNKTNSILLSKLLYSDIKEFVSKKNFFVIPNAIKDEITDKQFEKILIDNAKEKKAQLLFLSNMIESKGPLEVLKICKELKSKQINFNCNFVGKFPDKIFEKKFFNKINEFDLEKECKYLGPRYGKEKFKILEKTNYLIFPTFYPNEVFPLVILESFMYGIPVLSYDNGAIKEIISNKSYGFVARQGNWQELANNLIKRISKKENPLKIREHFKKNYIFEKSRDKLIKILK